MCQCWVKYLCAVFLLYSVSSVKCVSHRSNLKNSLDFGLSENNVDTSGNCVLDGNYTCIELLVRSKVHDFLNKKEFPLMENVVIEKLTNSPLDNEDDVISNVVNSRKNNKFGFFKKMRSLVSGRALRVDFLNLFRLRMSKAPNFPDEVELSFELIDPEESKIDGKGGKGHRTAKIVVPLVVGFIMTGLGILAISTVKAILMKAFFVSTVAALTAVFLVIKKALSAHSTPVHQPQPYYFAQYPIPYDTAYHASDYAAYGTPYNALSHYATINPTDDPWAAQYSAANSGHSGYSGTAYDTGASAGVEGTDEDSHGQFSHTHTTTVQNASSKMKRKSSPAGAFRGVIKLVKSQANRLPVLAYRHTGTGRKLAK